MRRLGLSGNRRELGRFVATATGRARYVAVTGRELFYEDGWTDDQVDAWQLHGTQPAHVRREWDAYRESNTRRSRQMDIDRAVADSRMSARLVRPLCRLRRRMPASRSNRPAARRRPKPPGRRQGDDDHPPVGGALAGPGPARSIGAAL